MDTQDIHPESYSDIWHQSSNDAHGICSSTVQQPGPTQKNKIEYIYTANRVQGDVFGCRSHPEAGKGERVGRQLLERRCQWVHVLRSSIQAATKTLLGAFVCKEKAY